MSYQAIETLPIIELGRIATIIFEHKMKVVESGDSWYSRDEVRLEIDRRVIAGLVASFGEYRR